MNKTPAEIQAALAAFFDPDEVRFKPQAVSGNRAAAVAYVDVRAVQQRLDDVLGVDGWSTDYDVLPSGDVVCRLRLRFGGDWIQKCNVGGPSEQQDGGDRMKAAFSDALKRAAVDFGVGRYLYRLPAQWVDYDPHKRQFVRPPRLPDWAVPGKKGAAATPAEAGGRRQGPAAPEGAAAGAAATITKDQATALFQACNARAVPVAALFERYAVKGLMQLPAEHLASATAFVEGLKVDGPTFARWLAQHDAGLAGSGKIQAGELVKMVGTWARAAGEMRPAGEFGPASIANAVAAVRTYVTGLYEKPVASK